MGYTMPGTLETASKVDNVGHYHASIIQFEERPTSKSGQLIDGVRAEFSVLAGTDPVQVKRTIDQVFFNPDQTHTPENQEKAVVAILRLAKAGGCLPPAKPGEEVEVNWAAMSGQQMIIQVGTQNEKAVNTAGKEVWVPKMGDNGKPFVKVIKVFELTDPEVAFVPLDERAVNLFPGLLAKVKAARAAGSGATHDKPTPASKAKAAATKPANAAPPASATNQAQAGGGEELDGLV